MHTPSLLLEKRDNYYYHTKQQQEEPIERRRRSKMKDKSVASSVAVDLELNGLDCTVCLAPLQPPVFQCAAGHVVCSSCYDKMQDKGKCPACSGTAGYNRCFALERGKNCVNMSMLDLDSDDGGPAESNAVLLPRGLPADCYALIMPKLSPSATISVNISGHEVTTAKKGERETPKNNASTGAILKMGPCGGGGGGGGGRDMDMSGVNRIIKIIIHHGDAVDAMAVVYERNGLVERTRKWGGNGGEQSKINLHQDEYLTAVHGHAGHHDRWFVVRSLTFVTNLRRFGPYGKEDGVPFVLPAAAGGRILGFHGRSDGLLDALGTYVRQD